MLSRVTAKNVGDVFFETHCRLHSKIVAVTAKPLNQDLQLWPAQRRLCFTRRLSICLSVCLYVCLSVCLPVSNLAYKLLIASSWKLPEMRLWTMKNWLHVWSHPPLNPDPRIFWRILQNCEIWHFPKFRSYLWKNWSDLHENLIIDVTSNNEVHAKFCV